MRIPVRRVGWGALGYALGLALLLAGVAVYLRQAQVAQLRMAIGERLELPQELVEVERVGGDGRLRIALRNVAIFGPQGDTLVAAPRVSLWFDAASIAGEGPLEFWDVELQAPYARLVQAPDGSWNLQAARVTAGGRDVGGEAEGRPVRLRNVRLRNGRVLLALPGERPDSGSFADRLQLPRVTMGGIDYQLYSLRDVDARLPLVRVGGERGWRVEVASVSAQLQQPELRVASARGWVQSAGEDGVEFSVAALQLGQSQLAGAGTVRFGGEQLRWDVRAEAAPLHFADLRALIPTLPEQGTASFALAAETGSAGRTALRVSDLELAALESRVAGDLEVLVGGGIAPALGPTRLELDPLNLRALEQLGLAEELPLLGQVRGTLATEAVGPDTEGARLQLSLVAGLVPRDEPTMAPSVVVLSGPVVLGGANEPARLDGVRLQLQPLYLATLAPLVPAEQRQRLRGEARGSVEISGTPRDLRFAGGQLVYQVGAAAPTRLADLSGSFSLDPELRYQVRAVAQPLALATLTEMFPALPFRAATLSGPLSVEGGRESIRYSADLTGPAGAIGFSGTAQLGTPLRFEVDGRVSAFTAAALLRRDLPLEGPVSGTFAARGTSSDLRFTVDLSQALGRFALEGRVQPGTEPPRFEVSGQVADFRIGTLLGQPGLFPEPMTGAVELTGGAGAPYRYDVDLRGERSLFDLAGTYQPGAVPVYSARGQVRGLDLRRLPFGAQLPQTNLNASLELNGQGTSLETLAGSLWMDARGSTVGGVPVEQARARVAVRDGVLVVDTLGVSIRGNRLVAEGMWGLTRPAPQPLRFALNAPNLSTLSRAVASPQLIQPQLAGSLTMEGWVSGSARYPVINVTARGRRLRVNDWRAGVLALEVQGSRGPAVGWGGQALLVGEGLRLAGGEQFQSVRLEVSGNQSALALGLFAQRDAEREIAVSGMLELEGRVPRGLALESLNLRIGDSSWRLVGRSRVRWGGVEGLAVENLALQRTGEGGGWIQVNGSVPPSGNSDLRINARGVELGDARRIWPNAPEIEGRLMVDALLQGPTDDPELTLQARIEGFRYQGAEAEAVALNLEYFGRRLEGRADVWMGDRQAASIQGSVPLRLSLDNLVPSFERLSSEPLTAQLNADSLPLQLIAASVPALENGAGVIDAQINVGGTLDRPELAGWARVQDGALTVTPLGVRYSAIRAGLTLDGSRVRIDSLTARSEGTASLTGLITLEQGAKPRLALTADLRGFRAMDVRNVARVTTSGRVALNGELPNPVLTGRLELEDASISVPELDEPTGLEISDVEVGQIGSDTVPQVEFVPAFLAGLRIDALEVVVGESVWLVSDEARVQIAGDLRVYRTADELRLFGLLQAVRGQYILEIGSIIREFDIVSGRVQFFGTPDLNPALDIVAAHRVRTSTGTGADLTVLVNITGSVRSPRLRLTSDTPVPLSESELFSLLIFGRPSFELGGLGGQFAEQILVQEVLGGILATELERPFLASGLCDYVRVLPGVRSFGTLLRFDPITTLNSAAIECGRELANGLFLTLETGIGGLFAGDMSGLNWGAGLEWQINNEWLWELQYGPVRGDPLLRLANPIRYQFSTDIRRRWEYGGTRRPSLLQQLPDSGLPGEIAPPREPPATPKPEEPNGEPEGEKKEEAPR